MKILEWNGVTSSWKLANAIDDKLKIKNKISFLIVKLILTIIFLQINIIISCLKELKI